MIKNKKTLITGIGGFLGSNIAIKLLENENRIVGIDRNGITDQVIDLSNTRKNVSTDLIKHIDFIKGDVAHKKTFEQVPKDVDYILHFGSPASIVLFNKRPFWCYDKTVRGMFNVLEFAKNNNVRKVVYPSSLSVYAGNNIPHKESIYPIPRNTYGAAKIACESLASSYFDYLDSIGLRVSAVYGPGEEKKTDFASVIYLFLNDIKKGSNPIIFGDGTQSRDFIYLDDAINAILKSINLNFKGIINVGSGNTISFNDLIGKIIKITQKKVKPEYVRKQINYVENLKADITLMKEKLSINPINIDDGIKKFAKYLGII